MKTFNFLFAAICMAQLSFVQAGFAREAIATPSSVPFGELAYRVGKALRQMGGTDKGLFFTQAHSDGTGIVKDPNAFQVYMKDPQQQAQTEYAKIDWVGATKEKGIYVGRVSEGSSINAELYFPSVKSFEQWLAVQSDQTMGVACLAEQPNCMSTALSRVRLEQFATKNGFGPSTTSDQYLGGN